MAEQQPLKEVSLRFPDGSVGPESKQTGGVFDGNDEKSEPFSYLTRKDDYEPPIPEPSVSLIEEAARKGEDKNTGLTTQPEWLSVLKKRQMPWFWLRWIFCNCFCNPRFTRTRAQWLWFLALGCLGAQAYYAYQIFNEAADKTKGSMEATVWKLSPVWNATVEDGYTAVLVNNMSPIRVDFLFGGIFCVYSLFLLIPVALGPFDRFIWIFWRQLDLAFNWWRWLALAGTLPMSGMAVCLLTGLRDQNTLAAVFMLLWCTVAGWFLTELWSRPHRNPDRSYDMNRWLGDDVPVKPGQPWTRLAPEEVCQRALQQGRRRTNYVIRMLPAVIAMFPFTAAWVIILNNYFSQLGDLRVESTDSLYKRTPDFIPMVVIGTLLFQAVHSWPLVWWQWASPKHYWKSEAAYNVLSLGYAYFLYYYLFNDVITKDSFYAAIALDQNATAA